MHSLTFQNHFFARSMTQSFNSEVYQFASDEKEPGLRKWLRATGKI